MKVIGTIANEHSGFRSNTLAIMRGFSNGIILVMLVFALSSYSHEVMTY